jgi:hypothetical protein
MRLTALRLIVALGIAAVSAVSANAGPMVPNTNSQESSNIVRVWGGCGWGFHPTYWGGCVPNRYAYYRPYWRPYYWRPYYYGYGYRPYWRYRYY